MTELYVLVGEVLGHCSVDCIKTEHPRFIFSLSLSSSDIDNPLECYNTTPSGEVDEKEVEVGDADVSFVPPPTDVITQEGSATPTMSNTSPTKDLQLKLEEENQASEVSCCEGDHSKLRREGGVVKKERVSVFELGTSREGE